MRERLLHTPYCVWFQPAWRCPSLYHVCFPFPGSQRAPDRQPSPDPGSGGVSSPPPFGTREAAKLSSAHPGGTGRLSRLGFAEAFSVWERVCRGSGLSSLHFDHPLFLWRQPVLHGQGGDVSFRREKSLALAGHGPLKVKVHMILSRKNKAASCWLSERWRGRDPSLQPS